ncbi:MAG TPA: alpha/beta fold hydrolase [Gemmataceae bacterium]|jgi:hypothetical protein|nr:alpha/beta fold hydrolase [Gemmataceae bacterium]
MPIDAIEDRPFRTLPFLGNPHAQTVLGNLSSWTRDLFPSTPHVVPLADGDAVVLHETTPTVDPAACCVLLLHGLGGTHRSGYLRRIANELVGRGMRVYRIDLRGCGDSVRHARRLYNAACSGDVRSAALWIAARNPGMPILVAGFSLGGNIALRLAGEAADDPVPGLAGIVSVGAPLDLARCSAMIRDYPFYDRYYSKRLVAQVRLLGRIQRDVAIPTFPRRLTIREFDALYTAPNGGFDGVDDYHRRASALPFVPAIRLPTYVLAARDDPFVAWQSYAELPALPNLTLQLAPRGGHLGFLGSDGRGGIRWAETQVIDWIASRMTS